MVVSSPWDWGARSSNVALLTWHVPPLAAAAAATHKGSFRAVIDDPRMQAHCLETSRLWQAHMHPARRRLTWDIHS